MASTTSATDSSVIPASLLQGSSATSKNATSEASDRFLKLLVTQMKNQDPLNPMDNAEVTSQMAQISTVSGIEKLNASITGMTSSFAQMQLLQGVSLVGRQVTTEGNALNISNGQGQAGFELGAAATSAVVEVKNAAGSVVGQIDLGSLPAGRHEFEWTPPSNAASNTYTFSVNAKNGSTALTAVPLSTDFVDAVSTKDGNLTLQLRQGKDVAYSSVKSLS